MRFFNRCLPIDSCEQANIPCSRLNVKISFHQIAATTMLARVKIFFTDIAKNAKKAKKLKKAEKPTEPKKYLKKNKNTKKK